uniref:Uncharacterized protein n=1 Tax=Cacopsylla melanoneura TaxID=428564 RepID=A0A8D9EX79_9HEMI
MPTAELSTTVLCVLVNLASLENRESDVRLYHRLDHLSHHQSLSTRAIHHHVDHTHNVETLEDHHHALAYQTILELHQTADPNVFRTQSVPMTNPVSERNVRILVQDLVVMALSVLSSIIVQYAHVLMVTLEMRSAAVIQNHLNLFNQLFKKTLATVFQTPSV